MEEMASYKIKELREERKLSQEELANMSGVSRATISKLENNDAVETSTSSLKKLAFAFGVNVRDLFF